MLNVLIADDEDNVLDGLKYIVDWHKLGFYICGQARTGDEALDKILNLRPDLVLLDIHMPNLLGIDVIRLARKNGFEGKFIILSGYADFKYAQTALRYGVDSYLVKPVDEDELENSIINIQKTLLDAVTQQNILDSYKTNARNTTITNLLKGILPQNTSSLMQFNLDTSMYQVVIYEILNQDSFHASYNFETLLRVNNKDNIYFDHIKFEGKNILLLKGPFIIDRFNNFISNYNSNLKNNPSLYSLFITLGRPAVKPHLIHTSYKDALQLLHRKFFCKDSKHFLCFSELESFNNSPYELNHEECSFYHKEFSNYIQSYNRLKINELLFSLQEKLIYSNNDINSIKYFLIDIYLGVKQNIINLHHKLDIVFLPNISLIQCIENKSNIYDIISFLQEQFETIISALGTPSSDSVLDDVLHYINSNFSKNIKLESIAPLFGYNNSYLGKLFKKKLNKSFNYYLDEVRINESKKLLLEENLKVYEIAEFVGYKNVDYFHRKFKKYVNQSPAEYRKSQLYES